MRACWLSIIVIACQACVFDPAGSSGAEPGVPDADPMAPDADPNAPDADPNAPDGALPDAFVPLGAFGTPVRIDAVSSSGATDDDPSVTGDLLELFFDSDRNSGSEVGDIFVSTRADPGDAWGTPSPIPVLNTTARETTPKISADGLTIWFSSDRLGGAGGFDIWVSTRAARDSPWTAPALDVDLNSADDDFLGGPTADGLSMIISSDRGAGTDTDLYIATRPTQSGAWTAPVEVAGINSSGTESDGYLSPNGLELWYMANNGGQDIVLATRAATNQPFGSGAVVGELSTGSSDRDAFLSPDLRYVVFATTRDGNWEIYEASR